MFNITNRLLVKLRIKVVKLLDHVVSRDYTLQKK